MDIANARIIVILNLSYKHINPTKVNKSTFSI